MTGLSARSKPFVEARVGAILESAGWVKSKRKGEYFVSWETWNEVGLVLGLRVARKLSTAEQTVFYPETSFGLSGYLPLMASSPDSPLPFEVPFSLGSLNDLEGAFPRAPMELLASFVVRGAEETGTTPLAGMEKFEQTLRDYLIPVAPRLASKALFDWFESQHVALRQAGARVPMYEIRIAIVMFLAGRHASSARVLSGLDAMKPAEWESPWIRETIPPAMERLRAALVSVGAW